jgi:serine phosphatase RsbU (regulator of sigma subunit)
MPPDAKAKILMVDDHPGNLLGLEATLEPLRQELVKARSGAQALRCLLDRDFALILMDAHMPVMDGFETAALIRQRDRSRHTPIIFLTAFERTDREMFRAYSVGAVDFLFKPIVPEVLRSKVAVFVELFRNTEEVRQQAELLREGERREHERRLAEERQRQQLQLAQEIQQKLFPAAPPRCPGFEIHGASTPAEAAGGDYFDYLPMNGTGLGVAVGDVCGHGLGPALLMAATRAYLRALVLTNSEVGAILKLANRALAADVAEGRFVTLLLGRLDPRTRELVYCSAGHPEGYVMTPSGRVRAVLRSTALPLGILPEGEFRAAPRVALEPGDLVLLLTDGILEATGPDGEPFGAERALDTVRAHREDGARAIVEALLHAVHHFAQGVGPADDLTALVVKVAPGSGPGGTP